jgi:hypothetical protein
MTGLKAGVNEIQYRFEVKLVDSVCLGGKSADTAA